MFPFAVTLCTGELHCDPCHSTHLNLAARAATKAVTPRNTFGRRTAVHCCKNPTMVDPHNDDTSRRHSAGVMLITGGSRGIGAATARMAAERGWAVAISYATNAHAADQVVADCHRSGTSAIAVQCEVADESSVLSLFDRCVAELGTPTCVVNNAGILFEMSRLQDMTVDRVQRVVDVNVIGAFLCAREAVRRMSTDNGGMGGSLVNVSSAASYIGSPNEFIDYAATKGALDTMTIGLAKEVAGQGIRVNAVRPGLIDTDIHADSGVPDRVERLRSNVPMQRGGTADEVASLILFLASGESSYVAGSLINVSGGR